MVRTRPCRDQCSLPVKFLKSVSVIFFLSVMVSAFLVWFWVPSVDETLAVAETGGCKPQAPSRGTETQRRLRASSARNGVCVLGGRRLWRAGGAGPPSATGGSRAKSSPPAGGHRRVKDRYRMAGTPRGPVRLWLKNNKNRRIEPDPQGHALICLFIAKRYGASAMIVQLCRLTSVKKTKPSRREIALALKRAWEVT